MRIRIFQMFIILLSRLAGGRVPARLGGGYARRAEGLPRPPRDQRARGRRRHFEPTKQQATIGEKWRRRFRRHSNVSDEKQRVETERGKRAKRAVVPLGNNGIDLGEDQNNNGIVDETESDPGDPDTDDDTEFDGDEVDPENINVSTWVPNRHRPGNESYWYRSDPTDPDTDDDGVNDAKERKGWESCLKRWFQSASRHPNLSQ